MSCIRGSSSSSSRDSSVRRPYDAPVASAAEICRLLLVRVPHSCDAVWRLLGQQCQHALQQPVPHLLLGSHGSSIDRRCSEAQAAVVVP
jgi:hypothetical protein